MRWRPAMGIRNKFVATIGAVVIVLGLGGTIHARLTVASIAGAELDRRTLAIARDLESRSNELLLTNDLFGLHRAASDLAAANGDVRYIVVFDAAGDARASTFASGLPAGLRTANPVPVGRPYALSTVDTNEGRVRDVALPIDGGRNGMVRVGVLRASVDREVDRLTERLLALTVLALAATLAVGYFLSRVLTQPLARLAESARAVGRGEATALADLYLHPEVGELAVAFDSMTLSLQEKEAERTELLARVIGAHEEERARISRELHDEAGQALASLLLGLGRLEHSVADAAAGAEAAELRIVATGALDRMRDLARELRPSTLDDLGLVAALERYVADYGARSGLETDFESAGFDARLRPEAETALYRIAQEALTNVARHASASSVNVLLERRNGHAVLVVEDDGCGFDAETIRGLSGPARRFGLLGMEERAALVGGALTIESRPGAGTAIFAEVPTEVVVDGENPDSR